jgi:Holliday junction resolvase RusA-like endonuclease
MQRINIKPLSVNEAWQGRRFKTPKYKKYESVVLMLLPKQAPKFDRYCINLVFGVSNIGQDVDNCLKPILDIFQKKYGFNDKNIFELNVKKKVVKKGFEFIEFEFKEYPTEKINL